MTDKPADRRGDLDFYRGFTLAQMVAAHLMMHSVAPVRGDETTRLFFLGYVYVFSAGFLMLTGVNVDLVLEKARRTPGFALTRFYALNAFGLFVLGWSYNLLEGSGPFTSVVQAIGVGVFVAYLLARVRLPNWAMPLVASLFFLNYFLAVGARIEIDPEAGSRFLWNLFIGNGDMTKEAVQSLWPSPYWFCMFGVIPSTGFVIMGLFIERLRGARMIAAGAVFLAFAVAVYFLPMMAYNPQTQPIIRADLRFLLQTFPLFTGWLLVFRHLYPRARRTRFTLGMERLGRLSLDFLVFHWIFIYAVRTLTPGFEKHFSFAAHQWIRAGLALGGLWIFLPRFDDWRKKLEARPNFLPRTRLILIGLMVLAVLAAGAKVIVLRMIAGAGAAVVFALVYPAQRESWRRSCMPVKIAEIQQ